MIIFLTNFFTNHLFFKIKKKMNFKKHLKFDKNVSKEKILLGHGLIFVGKINKFLLK